VGKSGLPSFTTSQVPRSLISKQDLNPFSRACTAKTRDRQTGRLTDAGNIDRNCPLNLLHLAIEPSKHQVCTVSIIILLSSSSVSLSLLTLLVSWSTHIENVIRNTTERLYFLKQLKRADLTGNQLLHFYTTVTTPLLEYCTPSGSIDLSMPKHNFSQFKNAQFILYSCGMSYSFVLITADLDSLANRTENLTHKFFLSTL